MVNIGIEPRASVFEVTTVMKRFSIEALAEPLASPACGGRHEGFCKRKWPVGARFGASGRVRG
jgi:hypothetical protein